MEVPDYNSESDEPESQFEEKQVLYLDSIRRKRKVLQQARNELIEREKQEQHN